MLPQKKRQDAAQGNPLTRVLPCIHTFYSLEKSLLQILEGLATKVSAKVSPSKRKKFF